MNLLAPVITPLEIQSVYTLLGVRFWDPILDQAITHDLNVQIWPLDMPAQKTSAFRTASGIYAFRGLPGMRHLEYSSGEISPWDDDIEPTRFILQMNDLRHRYLPLAFAVDVPYRGIFPENRLTSPGSDPVLGVWLFSSATRASTPALALLRADIRAVDFTSPSQPSTTEPAAYAVAEISVGDETWYGVAGSDGQVAIFFPYPTFASSVGFTSPVVSMPPQSWSLTIRICYEPSVQNLLPGSTVPDIVSLFDQSQASIWENEAGDLIDELPLDFAFGEEPVLHTGDQSTLWVTPV